MTKATITKKIVALLATVMLVVGMVVPAIAASQPDTGTITVRKYARATLGIADPDNIYSGERLSLAKEATLGTPLLGAGFTLYEIDMTAVDSAVANGNKVTGHSVDLTGLDPEVEFTFDGLGTPPVLTHTETVTTVKFAEQLTNVAGVTTFGNDDIEDGYYLLVETTNPDPARYADAEPSVIKLPLTLNDGSDYNRDITVYPKNIDTLAAIVNKTIGGAITTLTVDDVVPFKISTLFKNNAPLPVDRVDQASDLEDGGTYGSVKITDALAGYFTWVDLASMPIPGTKGLEVYLVDGAGVKIGANLVSGTDYTLNSGTVDVPGTTIEIELTNAGIDEAISRNASGLVMEFDAVYTGIGVTAGPGVTNLPVANEAEAVIRKANSTNPPIIPPGVYHAPKANIMVNKTFTGLIAPNLDGAVFALARGTGVSIIYDHTGGTTYNATELGILATEYVCGTNGLPVVGTTNTNGEVIFNNVPYTDAGVTYYLRELATKGGYALPNGHIAVTLDSKATLIADGSPLLDSSNNWMNGSLLQPVVVINNDLLSDANKDFSLPLTGGAGTIMFTIVGIVVMIGAATLIIKGKKRDNA